MLSNKKAKDDKDEINLTVSESRDDHVGFFVLSSWPLYEISLTPPWSDDTKMTVPAFKVDAETEKIIEEQTKRIEAYFENLKKENKDE